jgi:response regulator RpfG family c-di-GMP phosphodiesterase
VLAVLAGAGVLLQTDSVLEVVSLAVLAAAAILLGRGFGESRRSALEDEIDGRSNELRRALSELEVAQTETVRRLSMAVEFRDEDTGAHIERIGRLSTLLAEQIGMDPEFCERLSHAAPLHDVGKVAIPDAILSKPGPLDDDERAFMRRHTVIGEAIIEAAPALRPVAALVRASQERWDGSGYPDGLGGEAIPLGARIVAVCDAYSAMLQARPYGDVLAEGEALDELRRCAGSQFDPAVVAAFCATLDRGTDPLARV